VCSSDLFNENDMRYIFKEAGIPKDRG